jgi:GNAT superfamily N-acetyltransferase
MEREPKLKFTIEEMQPEDIESATEMRLQSWLDTYVNDDLDVTREWIEERNEAQLSGQKAESRRQRFLAGKEAGTFMAWVVHDDDGEVIGSTTPFIDEAGVQHVGSLYVDKRWHGTGVASQLMQKVIDWFDASKSIELGVVTYNERAKAFYRKWGFEEVPESETLFMDKMPEVMMVRKGDGDEV